MSFTELIIKSFGFKLSTMETEFLVGII